LEFDLVVVGGGPAGLAAVLAASKDTCEVLVTEKKRTFGDPVVCGEFVPSETEVNRLLPQATGLDEFYRFIKPKTVANKTRFIRLNAPNMSRYEFEFDGIVLDKSHFNAELAREAERRGIRTLVSTNVRQVKEKDNCVEILANVRGVLHSITGRFAIGADGFPSIVARSLALKTGYSAWDSVLCFNALMERVDSDMDTIELYVGKDVAPRGYAWIIPKGEGVANVGLGVPLCNIDRKHVFVDYVRRLLEGPEMNSKLSKARIVTQSFKIVPAGGLVEEVCTSKVLLAGDAAGAVIPVNGSGIPTALVSGSIAGACVARSLENGHSVESYRRLLESQLSIPIRRGLRRRRIADAVMRSDLVFNILVRLLGSPIVERTLRNEGRLF